MKPKLYILAGANGSGKSTISKVLLPAEGQIGESYVVLSEDLRQKFKEDL